MLGVGGGGGFTPPCPQLSHSGWDFHHLYLNIFPADAQYRVLCECSQMQCKLSSSTIELCFNHR